MLQYTLPALQLADGITEPATSPIASAPDLATSWVRAGTAQAEPYNALKLEGLSTGHLSPLCQDPPRVY